MLETTLQAHQVSQKEVSQRFSGPSSAARGATGNKHEDAPSLHQLNQELVQRLLLATAQVQALNQELDALTYSVSHDLRAPLRHITGFSKLLADEFGHSMPDEAQMLLSRILQGTQRMGSLIDDLLGLARLGGHELQLQITDLNAVVQEVVADLSPECSGRNVQWKIGPLPFLECDPALLKQAFLSLVSNALKFTRPRTHAEIEIGQSGTPGAPVIFVRDNGIGFSMKYSDKLFRVFQRMHNAEEFAGTGVGLARAHRIVRKHGGRIWAESELDRGATFYFTLCEPDEHPNASRENTHPRSTK